MKNRYCIYIHKREDNDKVFYVGKGTYSRVLSLESRTKEWKEEAKHGWYPELVQIHISNENKAYELEKFYIKKYRDTIVNKTDGGRGTSGFKQNQKFKDAIKKANSGKNNKNYNHTIYNFENIKTKEILNLTQNEFRKTFNLDHSQISALCLGKRSRYKDWKIKGVDLKKKGQFGLEHHHADKNIYTFIKNGIIEELNKYDFCNKYNLSIDGISSLIKGRSKTSYGWTLIHNEDE